MQTPIILDGMKFDENTLEEILQFFDKIHDAAKDGQLELLTDMSSHEVLGWLDDITYTTEETIRALTPPKKQN